MRGSLISSRASRIEYTKVDRIIDILFATAADVESQQEEEQLEPAAAVPAEEAAPETHEKTDRALIEEMKDRAIKGFLRAERRRTRATKPELFLEF